ncbi:hypothetical protein STCU_09925 [Strigomonas culicis]|uniref:Uncharacterized protein n=1 Tax=Strigomonas culicis TaxID=28005 RepID=S9V684_9TRYP|nr:hypothetical protein STCU_09925 [Strigomonas culicis]|eukprot:EPY18425.1 hypothetical protein STCU_09925 [Strigomonas culicis]
MPPVLPPAVQKEADAAKQNGPEVTEYVSEDDLSLGFGKPHSFPKRSHRTELSHSAAAPSTSPLPCTADPFVALRRTCRSFHPCDSSEDTDDVALSMDAQRPKPWQRGLPLPPPELALALRRPPPLQLQACGAVAGEPTPALCSPLSEALSPRLRRRATVGAGDPRAACGGRPRPESSSLPARVVHASPRAGPLHVPAPPVERDGAAGGGSPCGGARRCSRAGSVPTVEAMLDYTFQAFKKSVSEFSVSSDSSVQGSSTVRERVNSKLPPILMTRSDGSMGSPHRPPPPDECRGEWQNESILAAV